MERDQTRRQTESSQNGGQIRSELSRRQSRKKVSAEDLL
jgi:hypothetical protein